MKMPGEVFEEYRRFDNFVSKKLPKTRLYFSLPLPTTYKKECVIIEEVHHLMSDYIKDTEGDKSIIDRVTHVNRNYNMRSGNWEQKTHLNKADGIHLSDARFLLIQRSLSIGCFRTHASYIILVVGRQVTTTIGLYTSY